MTDHVNLMLSENRRLPARLWKWWVDQIDRLPEWFFSPHPKPVPTAPPEGAPESELEDHDKLFKQRKTFHDETSRAIRRVFYMLIGTSLFCIVALAGSPDVQVLVPGAMVKLPVLNYEIGFQPFLIVGPAVLIALVVYLHIFLGQHRLATLDAECQLPMLPNFTGLIPKIIVSMVFYGMVPLVLSVFAWKAWPKPYGPYLGVVAVFVTGGLLYLQARRLSKRWRTPGLPLLLAAFLAYCAIFSSFLMHRHPNLVDAKLNDQDLSHSNLSYARLMRANLTNATLDQADLSKADLREAVLTNARMNSADLSKVKLRFTKLSGAELNSANLAGAILQNANLSNAQLPNTSLRNASLDTSNLSGSNLSNADLSNARMENLDLSNAILAGANLTNTKLHLANFYEAMLTSIKLPKVDLAKLDLTGANLSGSALSKTASSQPIRTQKQRDSACGNEATLLPAGFTIPPCGSARQSTN